MAFVPLYLHLSVTDHAMSHVLFQEKNKVEQLVYLVSKVFNDAESKYQKIERPTLAIVIIVGNLIPYFQGHGVLVKTNYPIQQVLKKPYLI